MVDERRLLSVLSTGNLVAQDTPWITAIDMEYCHGVSPAVIAHPWRIKGAIITAHMAVEVGVGSINYHTWHI